MTPDSAPPPEKGRGGHPLVDSLLLLAAMLIVAVLMILFGRWRPEAMVLSGVDVAGHYAWLRSPLLDGDFEFGNEYEAIMEPHVFAESHSDPLPQTGRHANPFPIGTALALLPGFLIAHLLTRFTALGSHFPADGYSLPYGMAAHWSMTLWGTVGLILTHRWLLRRTSPGAALVGAIATWLGTNALYHCFPVAIDNHAIALAAMPLFLLMWDRWEEQSTAPRAIMAGVACGLLFLVRWQLVLWPVVFWLTCLRSRPRHLWLPPVVGLLIAVPQFLAWHHIYGQWLTKPQGDAYFAWATPAILPLLFSLHRGWISWTPLVLIGLLGWVRLRGRDNRLLVRVSAGVLLQLYISSVVDWHGSWGFAARRMAHLAPLIALGVALVLDALRERSPAGLKVGTVVLSLFVVWNGLFLYQHLHHLIPYHRPLTLHEFIGDKFHLATSRERRFAVMEAMAQLDLGTAALNRGEEREARSHFDRAHEWAAMARGLDPHHEDVYLVRAAAALETGQNVTAFRIYQQCLEDLDVDRPQILQSMGVAALYGGDAQAAAALAEASLAERPGYPRAERLLEDARDGVRDEPHPYFFF